MGSWLQQRATEIKRQYHQDLGLQLYLRAWIALSQAYMSICYNRQSGGPSAWQIWVFQFYRLNTYFMSGIWPERILLGNSFLLFDIAVYVNMVVIKQDDLSTFDSDWNHSAPKSNATHLAFLCPRHMRLLWSALGGWTALLVYYCVYACQSWRVFDR